MPDAKPYEFQAWPSWRYSPTSDEAEIFDSEAEVPKGWLADQAAAIAARSGSKVSPPSAPLSPPSVPAAPGADVDDEGTPWDPALHAATKGKTSKGLWRMKVGVSRPPKLDL